MDQKEESLLASSSNKPPLPSRYVQRLNASQGVVWWEAPAWGTGTGEIFTRCLNMTYLPLTMNARF